MGAKNTKDYCILLVDDEKYILDELCEIIADIGCKCICCKSAEEGLEVVNNLRPDIIITDICMDNQSGIELTKMVHNLYPNLPIIIMTGMSSTQKAIESLRAGAYDYIEKPFCIDEMVNLIQNTIHTVSLFDEISYLRGRLNKKYSLDNIIGQSAKMQRVFEKILKVAPTNSNILITGENGTGKELVANAIHTHSKLSDRKFMPINCSAIPANLLESQLFGHVKGSFTGAVSNKDGLVQAAEGGTLFLDEIGDMPLELQPKILRLLEGKEIQKVGSNKLEYVKIRIIAATNKNLKILMEKGLFRKDLYYRIQTVEISLPPLRERSSDLTLLALHFLKHYNRILDKNIDSISPQVFEIIQKYSWPGNVRELKNAIEHAMVFCETNTLEPCDLPEQIVNAKSAEPVSEKLSDMVSEFEKKYILSVLKDTNHDMDAATQRLGISAATIYRKLKFQPAKHNIVDINNQSKKSKEKPLPLFD